MQHRFPRPRRRAARVAALSACGLAVAASGAAGAQVLSGTAGASASKASAVVAATRKAILSQTAVRLTSTSRDASTHKVVETAVFDAGRTSSSQRYRATSARVAILLSPKGAWFTGNSSGLTSLFGMPSNLAAKVGTKWVAVKKSDAQYKDFSSAVLSSLPGHLLPSSSATSVHLRTERRSGKKLDVLAWTDTSSGVKSTYRLEIAGTGRSLPVRETQSTTTSTRVTRFSHWNERIVVRVPRHTIEFTKLTG